jgi:hypothetical protein
MKTGSASDAVLSRREFLAAATAVLGSGVLLTPLAAHTARATSNASLIDVHHHILPPIPLRSRGSRSERHCSIAVEPWSAKRALAEMDSVGVHTTILSILTNSLWFDDPTEYRRFVRDCNEYAARVVRGHSGRFGFFASVPLPDVDGTLEEIEYAIEALRADGVHLATSYGVRWIGDPAFATVLQEIDKRSAVASIHPPGANCCRALSGYLPYREDAPAETTDALTSLKKNTALARLRNIRYLFSHGADAPRTLSSARF